MSTLIVQCGGGGGFWGGGGGGGGGILVGADWLGLRYFWDISAENGSDCFDEQGCHWRIFFDAGTVDAKSKAD